MWLSANLSQRGWSGRELTAMELSDLLAKRRTKVESAYRKIIHVSFSSSYFASGICS